MLLAHHRKYFQMASLSFFAEQFQMLKYQKLLCAFEDVIAKEEVKNEVLQVQNHWKKYWRCIGQNRLETKQHVQSAILG